jgi:DNA-binding NtrC family response regulator
MTLGADDYLTKPFTRTELLDSIRIRLKRRSRSEPPSRPAAAQKTSVAPDAREPLVVHDPSMVALLNDVERVARGTISVLILGETGVGKERIAEEIHRRSGRAGPFVALNCGAINEGVLESELFGHERGAFTSAHSTKPGLLETADGGTLFLDEVGELPLTMQVKLLRVLEERKVLRVGARAARPVDLRVVSATNRDPEQEIERGRFRADLFYRLNGMAFTLPSLRERRSDIRPLSQNFVHAAAEALGLGNTPRLADETLEALTAYAWPGNIRELRNVIDRAVLLCDGEQLLPRHLPSKITNAPPPASAAEADPRSRLLREIEALERERVIDALARCAGNQTQAAELLGISRRTLVARLGQYELPRPRRRSP